MGTWHQVKDWREQGDLRSEGCHSRRTAERLGWRTIYFWGRRPMLGLEARPKSLGMEVWAQGITLWSTQLPLGVRLQISLRERSKFANRRSIFLEICIIPTPLQPHNEKPALTYHLTPCAPWGWMIRNLRYPDLWSIDPEAFGVDLAWMLPTFCLNH